MRDAQTSGGLRLGTWAALLVAAMTAAFCTGREVPKGQCVFNSDCESGEVCAGHYCRKQCNSAPNVTQEQRDRDCPPMYTCRPADTPGSYACYPPNVPYRCVYHSECNQTRREVCARDGFCRSQCVGDYDCQVLTGSRSSMCVREADAGGTCDFRFEDAGTDDAATDGATDAATDGSSATDGGTDASGARDGGADAAG